MRLIFRPPISSPMANRKPSATRTSGGIRSCSKEYLTKNAAPRNAASPPSHAKSFAHMNCAQSMRDANDGVGSRASEGGGSSTMGEVAVALETDGVSVAKIGGVETGGGLTMTGGGAAGLGGGAIAGVSAIVGARDAAGVDATGIGAGAA